LEFRENVGNLPEGHEFFARGRARYPGGPDAVTPAPGHEKLWLLFDFLRVSAAPREPFCTTIVALR
jgi:hypothetical protein